MMRCDSSDLSPKMSLEEIGNSLSSMSFDANHCISPSSNLPRPGPMPNNLHPSLMVQNRIQHGDTTSPNKFHWKDLPDNEANQHPVAILREEDIRMLSDTLEKVLESADETLTGLERDRNLLPSAILRKSHELADGLACLAEDLEGQSIEERNRLAEAIRDDLRLYEESASHEYRMLEGAQPTRVSLENDKEKILRALSGVSTLLRDVEAAFRDIGNDEAEEIADAALVMARLFLLSLQSIHSNLLNVQDEEGDEEWTTKTQSTVVIEELCDDDNECIDHDDNVNSRKEKDTHARRQSKKRGRHRMRVLWPPLGPSVDEAMTWTKGQVEQRPYLSVALGLTLWPVAISTALLGTSLVCIDGVLQETYERLQDGPWISALEQGAAQAYQAGRLTVVTSKFVGRQSLRVASRQIERHGGLGPVAHELGEMALDRIIHPIDTIGKMWDGLQFGFGAVRDATEDYLTMRRERQGSLM